VIPLVVVSAGESFAAFWPELARELGVELRVVADIRELDDHHGAIPPLLVVAGREHDAEDELRAARSAGLPPPLLVGAAGDHRLAVSLVKAGAADYFALPEDLPHLRGALTDALARERARGDRQRMVDSARTSYDFGQIVGNSPPLRAALERAARIIPHAAATVLITGETGTGKELLARAIHYNGRNAGGPFVEINCAAIPATLLESELFGYERGAFTDARAAKPGLFEAAHGGTLFLDEIGQLPLGTQGKLLKALEEKRVRRLGSLASRTVDLRIIAATNSDLAAAVEDGEFREDLFYRLSIIPIHLPPLRERGDDLVLLAEHFIRTLAVQYGLARHGLDDDLRAAILAHTWPGNVRELRNALERVLLLADERPDPSDLFPIMPRPGRASPDSLPFPAPLATIERHAALATVRRLGGNKSAAATALGISRSRLYRLLDGTDAAPGAEAEEADLPYPSTG
jgi:DNA-binding NtrC family response regulator